MDNISIEKAFDIIELKDKTILIKMQNATSYDEANRTVEELHEIIKKQRRILAKKYHPDVLLKKNKDEEKFKIINHICDKLLDIKAEPVVQRPVIHHHTIIIRSGYGTTSTTTSTTSYW